MNDPLPERFSDEKAKAILARAIELDSRAPVTTAAPLPVGAERSGEKGRALPPGAAGAAGARLPFWLRVARRVAGWLPRPQQRAASRGRGPLPAPQELAL